jgi:Leucine-rich repeat (LRR) protein
LGKLPDRIGNINTLKYLRVNHNYLKALPASILNLENLEELDISHNALYEIPEAVFNFKKLKILALSNNPWNEKTKGFLYKRTEELRARQVFVHIADESDTNHP